MSFVPEPPSQIDALTELFGSARRDFVPIRKTFAQQGGGKKRTPGPLAALVKRGVPETINQLLLLHARAAGRPVGDELNYDVQFESLAWARLLGLPETDDAARAASTRAVGRGWKALRELKLVETRRAGRTIVVTPLREDGSGEPYVHPRKSDDRYLKVPYDFWLDGHAQKLKVPGLAMALIMASNADWSPMPFDKGPDWYGIAASTVERGLRELRRAQLIDAHWVLRKAPLSGTGYTKDMRYRLRPPLGPLGHVAKGTPDELVFLSSLDASPPSQADSKPREGFAAL